MFLVLLWCRGRAVAGAYGWVGQLWQTSTLVMALGCGIIPCWEPMLEPIELARRSVEAVSEKQAADIVMLDTREVCSFADYFVICNGETQRQIEAICDEVLRVLKGEGAKLRRREGGPGSGWTLMDFGDVVVHIFSPAQRDYYQLEKLWNEATPLVRIQ